MEDDTAFELVRRTVIDQLAAIQSVPARTASLASTVLRVADGEVTRHRFVPLASCPVCGGAQTLSAVDDSWADASDPLEGWVDPIAGVIPELLVDPPPDTGSSLPIIVSAAPPHIPDDDGSLRRMPVGWGKGLTTVEAVRGAVSETIERYAASLPDLSRVVWRRVGDLDGDVLDPREFALYTDEQYARDGFPYARFDPDVLHPWIAGKWLGSDRSVWVPAVCVFLYLTLGPENLICQGTSSGLAASSDFDDAALRATLELIERDAFMVAWLTGARSRQIELDGSLDPALRSALNSIEYLGGAVELRLLSTSVFGTTVVALAFGDGERWPGVTLGLAADFDPLLALRAAILELCQTGLYLRRLLQSDDFVVPLGPESVREMLDHAAFYFLPARAKAFDRLRSNDEPIPLEALRERTVERAPRTCATALAATGVRIAVVDATSPDVATRSPFRVVRAVSPDLEAISFGHGLARAPTQRVSSRIHAARTPPIHPLW